MRRIAWALLLLFIFVIPWEYSLVLAAPLGNVARIAGLVALVASVPAVLQGGRLRTPGLMQWLVLALYLWFCCTAFWTMDTMTTEAKIRGYFQEMMIVWLVWEFAESADDLRVLLRVWLAGSWVLVLLTLADFASAETIAASQIRFAAMGQDPNDMARFLDLGFPLAALLFRCEGRRLMRLMAIGYLPLGLLAVLLTASRSGFVAALVALAGCGVVLGQGRAKALTAAVLALPAIVGGFWLVIPGGTLARLATIPAELANGNLNQRLNIWSMGWSAFVRAPWWGTGVGTFVEAAHTAAIDTAHNTVLALAVTGGLCAVLLALAIVSAAARAALATHGLLRVALVTALAVWMVTSLAATVEESRTTWLLLAVIALSGRLTAEQPEELDACFDAERRLAPEDSSSEFILQPE